MTSWMEAVNPRCPKPTRSPLEGKTKGRGRGITLRNKSPKPTSCFA
uniref:Putative N-acetyltransferase ycf52 n=1 Tax=Rhizophora mucronata TaxID=61149 RepID=A0A2P2M366_RHIMU